MNAGLFDVFHHPTDHACLPVGDAIDVHFGRVFKEAVDQHRALRTGFNGRTDVATEVGFIVNDLHRATTKNKGRTHQNRVSDPRSHIDGLLLVGSGAALRLAKTKLIQHGGEMFAILGHLDASRLRANDPATIRLESGSKVQWSLSTELHNHRIRLLALVDIQHVLERERLKVKLIAGIVIR